MTTSAHLGIQHRAATFAPSSFDEATRTVDMIWTTGAQVRRYSWARDEEFDEELVVEASAMRLQRLNNGAPFLNSHRTGGLSSIIGAVVPGTVRVADGRGHAKVRLSERPEVAGIVADIRAGIIKNVSVGYRVHRFERVAAADRKDGGARALMRAVDWEPMEISAVAVGADPAAQVREATADADHHRVLITERSHHMDGTTVGGNANNRDGTRTSDADAAEIRTIYTRHDLADRAEALIDAGATLEQAREALLDHLVRNDPAGRTVEVAPRNHFDRRAELRDAIVDGIMARVHPRHSPTVGREFAGLSLVEMSAAYLRAIGADVPSGGPGRVADAALGLSSRGAGYHTTSDFPAILGSAVNRLLLAEYEAAQSPLKVIGREIEARDFRKISNTRVSGSIELEKVMESGEFTYGTLQDGAETMQLSTYGKILGVSRQMLVNDDLSAFSQIPSMFALGAAETEAKILVGLLEANAGAGVTLADGSPLFHSSRGNILSPGAIVDPDAIATAYKTTRRFKGLGGETLNVTPAYLIVPPELEAEALKVVAAFFPANTSDVNPFTKRLEVLVEPRLADPGRWYVSAAAGRPDCLVYAYLAGARGVQIDTRVGFNVDGVEFKARLDFGAGFVDWRGIVTNPGL